MKKASSSPPWLNPGDPFPPLASAWKKGDPADGLLAVGGELDTATLLRAYGAGIFPWFSDGQPILWWSPDPRMVLKVDKFRLHRSLRKTLARFIVDPGAEIRIDTAFSRVISACAHKPRHGQSGTWIVEPMIQAYEVLHLAGHAHSIETWMDGTLVGGLYCVNIGKMVFGESMFAHTTDASKIALAALVALCQCHGVEMIDCQQNTQHLASLGAAEMSRVEFAHHLATTTGQAPPPWIFSPEYWQILMPAAATSCHDAAP